MAHIAILAFGSLIEDPGKELRPRIRERIDGIKTPFSVEFARSSRSRGGGSTLVPVHGGGSPVHAVLLALDPAIELAEAMDLLWRRETRNESSEMSVFKQMGQMFGLAKGVFCSSFSCYAACR